MTDIPDQPDQPLILTPINDDITVIFQPANGHNLIWLQFTDPHRGLSKVLIDTVMGRPLAYMINRACDRADDQPHDLN